MSKQVVRTERAPAPFQGAPYSQAVVHDDLVFVAGQIGIDPQTNEVVEGGIRAQTEQAMKNLAAILEAAGSSLANVLKTSIFLVDFGDFSAMNEVYASYVGPDFPARATVQIAGLPSGALVEIEVVAHL
ncbi:MAG TPA: Rid family detoxifying hydrolase [Gaiellaceae bacterium]|jgi:2-iminobutanoate/2-iminopropanoate deaminase|nr:Rid family detoxifying hydrolase [Gaiellaceae bacterium]